MPGAQRRVDSFLAWALMKTARRVLVRYTTCHSAQGVKPTI